MMQPYTFDPEIHIREIIVVGLGGTGSQLARSLCRMIFDMRSRSLQIPAVRFVDPDVVELKNVGRQMFAAVDVGRYKAEVLARRFSAALGLEITWNNEPFSPQQLGLMGHNYSFHTKVLLGAVDNHLARRELAASNALWIDCGNHYASGQVIIGNTAYTDMVAHGLNYADERGYLRHLPNAARIFPQLLEPDDTAAPDLSCADLVQLGEQHLLINDLIADVAAQYLYKLLHRQPIRSFMTFVDAAALSMRSVPITRGDLEAYLGPIPEVARPRSGEGLVESYEDDDDEDDEDDELTGYEYYGEAAWN